MSQPKDPDGKTMSEKLRAMADRLDADPNFLVVWTLYDGETRPFAYPHVMDGQPGAAIQMSANHWIWAPHEIALRLGAALAWAATESAIKEGEKKAGAPE